MSAGLSTIIDAGTGVRHGHPVTQVSPVDVVGMRQNVTSQPVRSCDIPDNAHFVVI
jgi:hypothetical protein